MARRGRLLVPRARHSINNVCVCYCDPWTHALLHVPRLECRGHRVNKALIPDPLTRSRGQLATAEMVPRGTITPQRRTLQTWVHGFMGPSRHCNATARGQERVAGRCRLQARSRVQRQRSRMQAECRVQRRKRRLQASVQWEAGADACVCERECEEFTARGCPRARGRRRREAAR